MFTNTKLKQSYINNIFSFCNSDPVTKLTNTVGCITPTTKSTDRRHYRIIPTSNMLFIYQLQEFSFTGNSIIDIPSCKFILMRGIYLQLFDQPIIQFTMWHKLECTY